MKPRTEPEAAVMTMDRGVATAALEHSSAMWKLCCALGLVYTLYFGPLVKHGSTGIQCCGPYQCNPIRVHEL